MKIALVAIVLVATALILAAVIYFIRRPKPYSPENLVLRGAINSIVDGVAHPEVQRLLVPIPGLKVSKPRATTDDKTLPRSAGEDAITQISAAAQAGEKKPEAPEDATAPEAEPEPQAVPRNIFREYDIRGLVDKELTPELMKKIGLAVGTMVVQQGRDKFMVGSDNRLSGKKLMTQLVKGLASSGLSVTDTGVVPTPVLYYSLHKHSIPDGIMLTGSHNGYEYNGCKIVINNAPLKSGEIQKLYDNVNEGIFTRARGSLATTNPFSDYVKELLQIFPPVQGKKLNVAVDCAHGVTGAYMPFVLRKLGCEAIELACGLDQNHAMHAPDPTVPEHLRQLQERIREHADNKDKPNIDCGLAYDGDGDRMVVIDDNGKIIWPDRLLMLFAKYALEQNPGGTVVYDVKCSSAMNAWIKKHGGKPLMWKTGHSLIRSKMSEVGAALAGEFSGHIFWREWHGFDDAIYSSCRLIQLLSQSGKKLSELFSDIPGGHGSPEYRIPMKDDAQARTIVEQVRRRCALSYPAKIVDIDGLRFEYKDRWGLMRPSNTSAVLVCRFEGDDEQKLASIQKEIAGLLQQADANLEMPF